MLKELAIRSGLGRRGKNTVVLHPEYGPRLRFMGVKTDAPLGDLAGPEYGDTENPVCEVCSICLDACPVHILEPYRLKDISICLSNVTPLDAKGRSVLCDLCLKLCPAGKTGDTGGRPANVTKN